MIGEVIKNSRCPLCSAGKLFRTILGVACNACAYFRWNK